MSIFTTIRMLFATLALKAANKFLGNVPDSLPEDDSDDGEIEGAEVNGTALTEALRDSTLRSYGFLPDAEGTKWVCTSNQTRLVLTFQEQHVHVALIERPTEKQVGFLCFGDVETEQELESALTSALQVQAKLTEVLGKLREADRLTGQAESKTASHLN